MFEAVLKKEKMMTPYVNPNIQKYCKKFNSLQMVLQ